ncbi:hypothetical protein BJX68DRAFT_248725 [Aspergillus pseudodeflectus]|uniref:Uncharacterized protein n=1 Tax=Aspergillus pseudodeflectus TaxID=176178 RepID=A0ABR4JFF9_9EURO
MRILHRLYLQPFMDRNPSLRSFLGPGLPLTSVTTQDGLRCGMQPSRDTRVLSIGFSPENTLRLTVEVHCVDSHPWLQLHGMDMNRSPRA